VTCLVAIDPGYAKRGKGCAVAVLRDGRLSAVFFVRPETVAPAALRVGAIEVVWERPQVDARTRVSAPAVVRLSAVGGELAGMFAGACGCRAVPVSPQQWKGSVAKPVAHYRLWQVLDPAERDVLGGDATYAVIRGAQLKGAKNRWGRDGASYYPSSFDAHNLLDAAALGLWRLRRFV
jgi:hypothetical protein